MSNEKAKAKQIQVVANDATPAGSLQELIETRKILPRATSALDGAMSKEDKAKLEDLPPNSELTTTLSGKVDKVSGKGLSTNDYSNVDKAKLASLESSHFRGVYVSESALAGIPNPVAGDYADIDTGAGSDAERWIYDASDSKWIVQESATSVTASQVKELYENNDDTNVFTDTEKTKLSALPTNQTLTTQLGTKADKTTQVIAGTGLTGGGTLAANRTLSVNYGTTEGTAAQGNDSRLSNSREWTAGTISQAEAEAGTATTRRAFTAQRVRQAVVAWFNGISSALGRTILSRTTAAEVRSDIGLGTAATRNVGTNTGNVMEVGAFGLGGKDADNIGKENFKDVDRSVLFSHDSGRTPVDAPETGPAGGFIGATSSDRFGGLWVPNIDSKDAFLMHKNGSAADVEWTRLVTSKNLLSSTGNSSEYPMSQNAVTDALAMKANTSTQVIAGTGLTGGGNLTANRTLNVTYGTTAGTAAEGNDTRLSNSREWTASAVSQAEAEAGTATTARKWTAQRVAQAISALGLKIGTTASTAKAGNWMPTWANVTGKPTEFTPSSHTHSLSEVTDAGNLAALNTNASTANFLRGDGAWVTPPNTNTVTSVRANNAGTYRTGNINIIGGSNVTVSEGTAGQFTIAATDTSTTYSAGSGLSLSGTTFSLPVTVSGSGSYVQSVAQDTNGLTVTLGTPPNTNTTYSEITTAEIDAGTASTLRTISGRRMKHALDKKANASHTHSYLPLAGGSLTGSLSVTGNITATGNVTAYSDIKLKEDIKVIPDAITKINALHGYTYKRKDSEDTSRYTGVIAQEVQKVLPEAVMEDEDGTLSVAYGNMVGLLIEAIKEQQNQIDVLKTQIDLISKGM